MISFVIITRNSERFIQRCISSIIEKCEGEEIPFEILVMDNGSSDKTVEILERFGARVKLKKFPENTGTTFPRNYGLKRAKGDVICIQDSDAYLHKGSLEKVVELLENQRKTGLVAPRLIYPDGKTQPSVKKFPTFLHKILKLKKIFLKKPPKKSDFYHAIPENGPVTVDSAISACWFFRKDILESVGLLDEKIFYSPEDVDFCLRIWKSGKSIVYYPGFVVIHDTQQISHKKPFSKLSLSHFKGLLYFFRKHGYFLRAPEYGEWEKKH